MGDRPQTKAELPRVLDFPGGGTHSVAASNGAFNHASN